MILRSLLGLGAVVAFAACGARSSLLSSEQTDGIGGASSSASTSTSASTSDTTTGSGGGGAGLPCSTWTPTAAPPLALTDPIGDSTLTGVFVEGRHVFVATTNDNDPSPDPTWRVRVLRDNLSDVGPSQAVLARPQSVSFAGLGIASGSGHRGGVAWDESGGCRFVPLAEDGSAAASPAVIDNNWCYWLTPNPSGFVAFVSPIFAFAPLSLLTLDAAGHALAKKPGIVPEQDAQTFPMGHAQFDDGSILVAWASGNSAVIVQRFSQAGEALSQATFLVEIGSEFLFSLTSLGSSALVAWTPEASQGKVFVASIQKDLTVDSHVNFSGPALRSLSLGKAANGALVAWATGADRGGAIFVMPVAPNGDVTGKPVSFETPPFTGNIRVVGTPLGAMAVFDAELPGTLTQVFAKAILCEPENR